MSRPVQRLAVALLVADVVLYIVGIRARFRGGLGPGVGPNRGCNSREVVRDPF